MHPIPFLADFVVLLAAAVAVVLASERLRIPSVAGFLLTGVLIGPSGLGLVGRTETVEVFAEIGVVALLFTVGLEFSLERLREIRRPFFVGGGLQAALTTAAAAGIALAAGAAPGQAAFMGFLLTLSSTAIVLKLLDDRQELTTPQGNVAVGILLFQDFLIVPMMLLVPVLAGRAQASIGAVAGRFALGTAVVAGIFLVARYLMPRVLYAIVRTRVREVLVLSVLGLALGLGLLTESLGLSLALGAFVAGIVLSESEYSHQVVAEVLPFRDVFNSVFFISVGMLLDLGFVLAHPLALAAAGLGVVALKGVVLGGVVRLLSLPARTALAVAAALAQVGEFSFVLAVAGRGVGLLEGGLYQGFLAVAVLSMLATPLLVAAAPRLAARLPAGRRGAAAPELAGEPAGHVIVVGFGVSGRSLARVLARAGVPYRVVELNGEAVRRARAAGEPILYGDAARREILEQAGIARAQAAVFAISDPVALRRAIATARALAPRLHLVVRTRRLQDLEELERLGADEVIAEELETAIEIFTRVLARLGIAPNVVEAETRLLRGDSYRMLRAPAAGWKLSEKVAAALARGTTSVFQVEPEHHAAGRTLGETGLRRATGASVLAVVRGEEPVVNPPADLALAAGDALVLVGGHAQIRAAMDLLERGAAALPQRPPPSP